MSGTFYITGTGPGDPDLITLKALQLITSGAVIAYVVGEDSGESLARRIVAPHIPANAVEYGFHVPMRVERSPASDAYDQAASDLSAMLSDGKDVVLLCEGDPFFYGSAMYLFERLAGRHETRVVPGVTSLTACAATARRPLVARNEVLKVLPAPLDEQRLAEELATGEAAAIVKIGRHFEKVRRVLRTLQLDKAALIVEAATDRHEKLSALTDLPEGERPYFSTILVYRGTEAWKEVRHG